MCRLVGRIGLQEGQAYSTDTVADSEKAGGVL